MLSVSVRLESSARSFIKPSPEDDIFDSNGGSGPERRRVVAVSAICPHPRHLLFSYPPAHEAAAEEGGRIPDGAQGRGQGGHDERHLWADHEVERKVGAGPDRRQSTDR